MDGEVKYSLFANAIRTATTSIPALPARQRATPWAEDEDIQASRQNLVDARRALQVNRSNAVARKKVEVAARALSNLHTMKREETYQSMMKEVECCDEANRPKAAWHLINMLTGRKVRAQGIIAADTPTERLQGWRNHFESLLSPADSNAPTASFHCEPVFQSPPQFEQGLITSEELDSAVKALRAGRAPGLDQVTAESLKLPELHEELLEVLNSVYLSDRVPPEWHLSALIPIPKKGDLSLRNNYRGIVLMSIPAKLYNRILLSRIRNALDSHLRNNQNGFRPHRSTTQHVLALRRLIEGCQTKQVNLVVTFIDFKKAFDSIRWAALDNILSAYGIPPKLRKAVMALYYGAKVVVTTTDGAADPFDLSAGVLQGDTLAPYLFVLVVDYVLRCAIPDDTHGFIISPRVGTRSRTHSPAVAVSDLDFADDIALLSHNHEDAQALLTSVEQEALTVGLKINRKKTEYMLVGDFRADPGLAVIEGPIARTNDFKYLGSWVVSSKRDFEVRRAQAWQACKRMRKVWGSNVSRNIKVRLFQATVETVLLYGAEAWTLTKGLEKALDGTYTRLLRYALGIRWQDHRTNTQVYQNIQPISERLCAKRLKFAGHCARMQSYAPQPVCQLLMWEPKAKGRRGMGAKQTYPDVILRDCGMQREDRQDLWKAMHDKNCWRYFSQI